jgi:hypothetical protein
MRQTLCALSSRSALWRYFALLPRKAYKAALSRYEPKYWRQETNRFRNTPLYIRRNRQICTTGIETIFGVRGKPYLPGLSLIGWRIVRCREVALLGH